jgi:hypothetical protein
MELYSQFCILVPNVSVEETGWVAALLERWLDEDAPPEPWWSELDPGYFPTFNFLVSIREISGKAPKHVRDLVLFTGDHGNPDEAAILLQHFLEKFRPESYVAFEVAYTTDEPLNPAGFGGAAYLVTKDGFEVMSTLDWLQKRIAELNLEGPDKERSQN